MTRARPRQEEPAVADEGQDSVSPALAEGKPAAHKEPVAPTPAQPAREPIADVDEPPLDVSRPRKSSPVGTSVAFVLRAACYMAGRAADRLVSAYSNATSLDRDYIADFNKSSGLAHARSKRWDKAIPLLEKSLEVAPDDVETRMRLAEAYAAEQRYERACEHLEKVLEINPDSAAAVRALGAICVRQQDYDRAIEYLEKAVRLDPDHAQSHYRLGIAYDNRKRYEQAVEAFRKSIRLDPRFAKAYQALGFTYETMGNRDKAVECFKKALELE